METIKAHAICVQYPSAVIDLHYILKLRDRFDSEAVNDRVVVLTDEVNREGYTSTNISNHAIIDVAKRQKIHHFLVNHKFEQKIMNKVKSNIKNM